MTLLSVLPSDESANAEIHSTEIASDRKPFTHDYADLSASDASDVADREQAPSKRERARSIGQKAKVRAKRVLHIDGNATPDCDTLSDSLADDTRQSLAFNPRKVYERPQNTLRDRGKHLIDATKAIGHAAVDPKDSAKQMIAKKLATPERPFLSREADAAHLAAQERLDRVHSDLTDVDESDEENGGVGSGDKLEHRKSEVERSQMYRESLEAAYVTSRYVHRVRVMGNKRVRWKSRAEFREYDECGGYVKTRWDGYLAHMALYYAQDPGLRCTEDSNDIPYDRDMLLEHVERIVIASQGWQSWLVSLRRLYRWENPRRTGKWLAIYLLLWYANYIITFWWAYGAFVVLQNRYNIRSLSSLRQSHQRTLDRESSAFRLSELITKHGNKNWLDPLEELGGPIVQTQLQDAADFFEVLNNYYEWKDARMTWATLLFMAVCVFIGLTTPTEFSLKIALWIGLIFFFLGRPIASHAPRYRHLVSPLKWVYWDIPTNAEWAFRYLREEAARIRTRDVERRQQANEPSDGFLKAPEHYSDNGSDTESSASSFYSAASTTFFPSSHPSLTLPTHLLLNFRARCGSHTGYLCLTSSTLSFTTSTSTTTSSLWSHPYASLLEMRKTRPVTATSSTSTSAAAAAIKLGVKKVSGRGRVLELHFGRQTEGEKRSGEPEKGADSEEREKGERVERLALRGGKRALDAAFNRILGFSGLEWKVLQPVGPNQRK